jgi:hypothetical protein
VQHGTSTAATAASNWDQTETIRSANRVVYSCHLAVPTAGRSPVMMHCLGPGFPEHAPQLGEDFSSNTTSPCRDRAGKRTPQAAHCVTMQHDATESMSEYYCSATVAACHAAAARCHSGSTSTATVTFH